MLRREALLKQIKKGSGFNVFPFDSAPAGERRNDTTIRG